MRKKGKSDERQASGRLTEYDIDAWLQVLVDSMVMRRDSVSMYRQGIAARMAREGAPWQGDEDAGGVPE
jgi:hypothetical protein